MDDVDFFFFFICIKYFDDYIFFPRNTKNNNMIWGIFSRTELWKKKKGGGGGCRMAIGTEQENKLKIICLFTFSSESREKTHLMLVKLIPLSSCSCWVDDNDN